MPRPPSNKEAADCGITRLIRAKQSYVREPEEIKEVDERHGKEQHSRLGAKHLASS
jgi:hypothetical protein